MQRLWFTSPSGPVGAAVKTGSVRTCFPFPLPFEMSGTRLEEILVEGVKEVRVNVCECPWLELASMGTAGHAGCLPACCLPLSLGTGTEGNFGVRGESGFGSGPSFPHGKRLPPLSGRLSLSQRASCDSAAHAEPDCEAFCSVEFFFSFFFPFGWCQKPASGLRVIMAVPGAGMD